MRKRISISAGIFVILCMVNILSGCDVQEASTSAAEALYTQSTEDDTIEYDGNTYPIIEVDGGDMSGTREDNVAVDIGYGDREYWGITNAYGQLFCVLADEIVLQDDETEAVTSDGRYYADEADVPGTELSEYDKGHVIADSLGGVSNAYNITPQNSVLNRTGDQAYMEKAIRDADGCEDFIALITYPDTGTQIPSSYHYEYTINGNTVEEDFANADPSTTDSETELTEESEGNITAKEDNTTTEEVEEDETPEDEEAELARIDTNGNGKVTIAEAEAAGYTMPITSDCWLYQYMTDADGDGEVGE